ncbi:class I SAM-dependent methyltransferase [Thermohalobacter berrensis]|uniref:Methyltransferase type 11 n=1 Tax=Thermohalobacter berrensis TaxID=99594 RepID=A0A419T2L3_9FIRM|nr:class I SAM-dependent methyltransferase [Thermohalobacter berrensis]RKD31790.1 methyltransferase type 11 [Thermohalobacter berrensis]
MDKKTKVIQKRYNRIAKIYDLLELPLERLKLSLWRKEAISHLEGKVLEVGIGTGKNLEYYPEHLEVTGIDISDKMINKAKNRGKKLNKKVKLIQMDVQNLSFEDNKFDSIYASCVFCSVPDPVKGLREIKRVCKKDGKIVMIEHMRSEKKIMGIIMDIFNPLVVKTYGANINRRTVQNIKKVGWKSVETRNLWSDVVKMIIIDNSK